MTKLILIALITLTGTWAWAQEIGIVAGMRADSAEAESAGVSTDGKAGFQGGGLLFFPIDSDFSVRTGLLYTQRKFSVNAGNTVVAEPSLGYFEVPGGISYRATTYASPFVGANAAFNISKDCGAGSCSEVTTLPLAFQAGATFTVTDRFGFEAYYEYGFTNLADELKSPRALVGQLMIKFD